MPKGLLQEKMQRTVRDPKTDGDGKWASFEKQRVVYEIPTKRITSSRAGAGEQATIDMPVTNRMPPGMFIDNQLPNVGKQVRDGGLAGSTDESNGVDGRMLKKGFQRQTMSSTDEMYTNEHVEEFYGEATVDGETGFLERNNYLDRN